MSDKTNWIARYGLEWTGPKDFVCKPMPDGYWTPYHIAQSVIEQQAAELERLRAYAERVIAAIDAEPELPGDMPPEMAAAVATAMINEDANFFIHALRLAVRMTKEGIRNRVVAARGE